MGNCPAAFFICFEVKLAPAFGFRQSQINTAANDYDPCISPDESFLIFTADGRKDIFGGIDLYISFRLEDGSWSTPKNMGEKINSSRHDVCPYISPDGKYFFFTSNKRNYQNYSEDRLTYEEIIKRNLSPGNGRPDIYCVDAGIISELKSTYLK
jgi:Tol biopolymer transport system component